MGEGNRGRSCCEDLLDARVAEAHQFSDLAMRDGKSGEASHQQLAVLYQRALTKRDCLRAMSG